MPLHPLRPIIGVTGPDRGGGAAWIFTWLAVILAGGYAVRITPRRPRDISRLDGLIVGGGADVNPTLYGQELMEMIEENRRGGTGGNRLVNLIVFPLTWLIRKIAAAFAPRNATRDPLRDAMEMRLIHGAVQRNMPILGICRGCQLLNVHFGGSLFQSIAGFYVEDREVRSILPRKHISVPAETTLAKVLGEHPQRVNALHRQAIHQLGKGLRVAARDRNGIIQAIEHESMPFVVGVQWHPEYLPQMADQRALFKQLVSHVRSLSPRKPSPVRSA